MIGTFNRLLSCAHHLRTELACPWAVSTTSRSTPSSARRARAHGIGADANRGRRPASRPCESLVAFGNWIFF